MKFNIKDRISKVEKEIEKTEKCHLPDGIHFTCCENYKKNLMLKGQLEILKELQEEPC